MTVYFLASSATVDWRSKRACLWQWVRFDRWCVPIPELAHLSSTGGKQACNRAGMSLRRLRLFAVGSRGRSAAVRCLTQPPLSLGESAT